MIASMTGFGAATGSVAGCAIRVEVRTVNHRALDVVAHLPEAFSAYEPATLAWCRGVFARGRVDIAVRSTSFVLWADTKKLFTERAASLKRIISDCDLPGAPTLQDLLSFGAAPEEPRAFDDLTWSALRVLFDAAAEEVRATRAREGASLVPRLVEIVDRVAESTRAVRDRYATDLAAFRHRQESRLAAHGGPRTARDEDQIPLLVFGHDATEELDRLDAHTAEVRRVLATDGPAGRRLDFLATEMLREASTLTAKCPSPELSERAIDLRCELERLREQAQNVE